jgi:hypothetical protein
MTDYLAYFENDLVGIIRSFSIFFIPNKLSTVNAKRNQTFLSPKIQVQVLRLFFRPTLSDYQLGWNSVGEGGRAAAELGWSMVLVLPRQRFGLGALLATGTGVSGRQLIDWTRRCKATYVEVCLFMLLYLFTLFP